MTQQKKIENEKDILYQYSKIGKVRTSPNLKKEKKPPPAPPPKPVKTHPDGGWGWCVVMAAFCVQFIILGLQNSSGVIFNQLVKKFDGSRGETGFVSSISCGIMFILGPLTTSLCERFTCRVIALFGGVLCVAGMIASAYATSLKWMYLSFGVTWGLGTSFCYFPTLIILVPYFNKKLALVNGIAASGSGVGTLVLSPFIQWFAQRYGVENMFFMLAALHGFVLLAGFVYRPISKEFKSRQHISAINSTDQCDYERQVVDDEEKRYMLKDDSDTHEEKQKLFDFVGFVTLITDKAFMSWSIGLSVFILGYFVPFVHLVRYARLKGVPEVDAAFLISILSITATIFKVISGKIAGIKNINKLRMYQSALLIMTVATTLIPLAQSYIGFVIYAVVFGISESCFLVMIPLITKDIIGIRRLPLALGVTFMSMGFTTVLGAPIAGWIYDAFGRYSYAFYLAGGLNASGVLIMFLINIFNTNEIHKLEAEHIIEDEVENENSKVIEYTCFASSERIYYSTLSIPNAVSSIKSLNDVDRAAILKHGGSLNRSGSRSKQRPQSCVLTPIRENARDRRSSLYLKSVHPLEKSVSCMQLERKDKDKELLLPIVPKAHNKSKEKQLSNGDFKEKQLPNGECKPYKVQIMNGDCKVQVPSRDHKPINGHVPNGVCEPQKEQYDTKNSTQTTNQYALYPKELYKPLSKTANNKANEEKIPSYQLLSTINEHTFLNARVTSL